MQRTGGAVRNSRNLTTLKTFDCAAVFLAVTVGLATPGRGADVTVHDAAGFRAAVGAAQPGTRILLAGGVYGAGFHFANLRGERGRPIVIAAADTRQPPIFRDGNIGMHLSNPAFVELHNLVFTKLAHNGLNIDDGSATAQPESAHHITL